MFNFTMYRNAISDRVMHSECKNAIDSKHEHTVVLVKKGINVLHQLDGITTIYNVDHPQVANK